MRDYALRAAPGLAVPGTITLRQTAEMRAEPDGRWQPLTARQVIGVRRPGFVWVAQARLGRLLPVSILDAYAGGRGLLEARLFGSLRVARMAGPQADKGELMRYLAELPWAPHAMLHNPHLRWRMLDAATAEVAAACSGGPARVRLVFRDGDVIRAEADDRPRAVGRGFVPARWAGEFGDYREMGGCRIPTRAEVSWLLDFGRFACWRGTVTAYAAATGRTPPRLPLGGG